MQTDPVGYSAGINLYAYCSNNSVNYTDPMGLCDDKNEDKKLTKEESDLAKAIQDRIQKEIEIRNAYDNYLKGKSGFPKFEKGQTLAYNLFGFIIFTKEGKKLPEWQKKYEVIPHEKAHNPFGAMPVAYNQLTGHGEAALRYIAKDEVRAYGASIQSLKGYLETIK